MLPKPANFDADYKAVMKDSVSIILWWDPVPGASFYRLYRDGSVLADVKPPYTLITKDSQQKISYVDNTAWFGATPLDIFYWVAAVEVDQNNNEIEGELAGALTNLHPKAVRYIEEAKSFIGDDLRVFNDKSNTVLEQVSIYNYKIAMDNALADIASTPTPTPYLNYANFPPSWKNLLILGTLVFVLPRLILFEQAKQMKFSSDGREWTPPDLSGVLKEMLNMYKEMYNERKIAIKHNVRPHPRAIGSLRALYVAPQLLKWRHVPDSARPFF